MHPAIDNSIAALRARRHNPPIEILYRHRAKIRSVFFIVACSAVLATGVVVVMLRSLNQPVVLEREYSVSGKVALRSTVREASALNWKFSRVNLPPDTSIEQIQMLNPTDGWLAAYPNELYATSDGGEHWTRVQLKLPARSSLTDVQFVTQKKAWVAASKTEFDFDDVTRRGTYDNATWILDTEDGGKTITERLTIKDAEITQIRFADENEGWATGRRFAKQGTARDSNLVLHTTNGGKDWNELSARLPSDKGVERLQVVGPSTTLVMTHDGSIYKTADGGANWIRINKLTYQNEQVAIWRLHASNERLWVVGGASAVEGTQSLFATKDKGEEWVTHEIGGIHLTDALFLSDSEVLACGSMLVEFRPPKEVRQAVLMYSADKGKIWNVISRYPQSTFLNHLALVNSTHVFAVGERGLIVKVGLPLDRSSVAAAETPKPR